MTKSMSLYRHLLPPVVGALTVVSLVYCFISYGLIRSQVDSAFDARLKAYQQLFVDELTNDVLVGSNSEVFRKCRLFSRDEIVAKVQVVSSDGRVLCNVEKRNISDALRIDSVISFNKFAQQVAANVMITYDLKPIISIGSKLWILATSLLMLLFLVFIAVVNKVTQRILKPITEVADRIGNADGVGDLVEQPVLGIKEVDSLIGTVFSLFSEIKSREIEAIKHEQKARLVELASQVAHDIKSPLSALNMGIANLDGLSEERRILIRQAAQRINDISNQLLKSSRESIQSNQHSSLDKSTNTMVIGLLESLVSEKRLQYMNRRNVEIKIDNSKAYGLFVNINTREFSRAVSNVINNSIESTDSELTVSVSVNSVGNDVIIQFEDSGPGIDPLVIERLGHRGESHGKFNGNGLGLSQVRQAIEADGGRFKIESKHGRSTTVTLTLPKAERPNWFVELISLNDQKFIVTLDDEKSVHKIWSTRFLELSPELASKHRKFERISDFEEWFSAHRNENSTLLLDFELLGELETGLDLIERLNLAKQSVLVTSRHEDPKVLRRAERLRLRVLPKQLSSIVPLAGA